MEVRVIKEREKNIIPLTNNPIPVAKENILCFPILNKTSFNEKTTALLFEIMTDDMSFADNYPGFSNL